MVRGIGSYHDGGSQVFAVLHPYQVQREVCVRVPTARSARPPSCAWVGRALPPSRRRGPLVLSLSLTLPLALALVLTQYRDHPSAGARSPAKASPPPNPHPPH